MGKLNEFIIKEKNQLEFLLQALLHVSRADISLRKMTQASIACRICEKEEGPLVYTHRRPTLNRRNSACLRPLTQNLLKTSSSSAYPLLFCTSCLCYFLQNSQAIWEFKVFSQKSWAYATRAEDTANATYVEGNHSNHRYLLPKVRKSIHASQWLKRDTASHFYISE